MSCRSGAQWSGACLESFRCRSGWATDSWMSGVIWACVKVWLKTSTKPLSERQTNWMDIEGPLFLHLHVVRYVLVELWCQHAEKNSEGAQTATLFRSILVCLEFTFQAQPEDLLWVLLLHPFDHLRHSRCSHATEFASPAVELPDEPGTLGDPGSREGGKQEQECVSSFNFKATSFFRFLRSLCGITFISSLIGSSCLLGV